MGINCVADSLSRTVGAILTLSFNVVKTQCQAELGVVEAVNVSPLHADSTCLLLQRI